MSQSYCHTHIQQCLPEASLWIDKGKLNPATVSSLSLMAVISILSDLICNWSSMSSSVSGLPLKNRESGTMKLKNKQKMSMDNKCCIAKLCQGHDGHCVCNIMLCIAKIIIRKVFYMNIKMHGIARASNLRAKSVKSRKSMLLFATRKPWKNRLVLPPNRYLWLVL